MEFIDAEYKVDLAVGSWDENEVAIWVTAARLEINAVFAGYIVHDDEVVKASRIRSIQGAYKAHVCIAISMGKCQVNPYEGGGSTHFLPLWRSTTPLGQINMCLQETQKMPDMSNAFAPSGKEPGSPAIVLQALFRWPFGSSADGDVVLRWRLKVDSGTQNPPSPKSEVCTEADNERLERCCSLKLPSLDKNRA